MWRQWRFSGSLGFGWWVGAVEILQNSDGRWEWDWKLSGALGGGEVEHCRWKFKRAMVVALEALEMWRGFAGYLGAEALEVQ